MIRILHVDDCPSDRALTRVNLTRLAEDIVIEETESALKAPRILENQDIDCVLCDFQMEEMDGLQLLRLLREQGNKIPFIFFTGQGNEEIAAESFRAGADDYFNKEIGFAHYGILVNSIRKLVVNYQQKLKQEDLEKAHRQTETLLKSLFNAVPGLITIQDKEYNVLFSNWYNCDDVSNSVKTSGPKCYHVYGKRDSKCPSCTIDWIIRTGESVSKEVVDSETGKAELVHSFPILDEYEDVIMVGEYVLDMTKQKLVESSLREKEIKYKALFHCIADPVFIIDNETRRFLDCNEITLEKYGYTRKELFNMTQLDLLPDSEKDVVEDMLDNGTLSKRKVFSHCLKNGSEIKVEIHSSPYTYDGRESVISIARDITDRYSTYEKLQASEQRFRSMVEYVPHPVFTTDTDGVLTNMNSAFESVADKKKEYLLSTSFLDLLVTPDEFKAGILQLKEHYSNLPSQKPSTISIQLKCGSEGLKYDAVITPEFTSPETILGFLCVLMSTGRQ